MSSSGYPDSTYQGVSVASQLGDETFDPTPDYSVESGTNCSNAKPYLFWDGAYFCSDVTVNTNLTITENLIASTGTVGKAQFSQKDTVISVPVVIDADTLVKGYLTTSNLVVQGVEFRAVRLPGLDNYYVLASRIPS